MEEYIPFIVGAGLFLGAIIAGVWKGKQDTPEKKEVVAGVIQDNYSLLMFTEQLRVNKEQLEKVTDSMKTLTNEIERLREHAKDVTKAIESAKTK